MLKDCLSVIVITISTVMGFYAFVHAVAALVAD
jgi:Na+/H+ antiporter NhaB